MGLTRIEGQANRATRARCLALGALAMLMLSGCSSAPHLDGSGSPLVRAKGTASQSYEDSEIANRTLVEHLRFWDHFGIANTPPPTESFTLRPDGLKSTPVPAVGTYSGMLASAQELFRQGKHAEAVRLFRYLADRERIPANVAEEARYYQAECYRMQGYYPDAADTYVALLNKFPTTLYKEQAVQHLYDIANYWLDDTRERMKEVREWREGKRWWIHPRFFSLDDSKPFMDREGHALKHLEQVRFNDINGPLADKALFLCGSVKYFNEDYREADYYFTQIHERHPNSPLAAQAVELAIVSKHMSTGGSDYDGRKAAEARKLIDSAMANYPELKDKREQLEKQRMVITFQQAEKDFKQADFYQRQGKLGAAYFYYEIVKNSYPGTPYAQKALERIEQIRTEAEQRGVSLPPPTASGPGPVGAAPRQQPTGQAGGPEQAPPPRRN